jgi:hypothetical protein
MTRDRIAELLELFVDVVEKIDPPRDTPDQVPPSREEWIYIDGLVCGAVLRLRAQVLEDRPGAWS